ncbi:MAG TPA: ABC transporter ATP-binding protein [Candidatus Blautia faecavium]|uniref:ABC transporter ATP-binding protein n=1 Tax=Candidatus Blautia faecavium TaxID=2838487 RepID=A0A9D2LUC3_9FIRM|nr:ABC transporter ATP-binding protein [Candidatus Blautia faecavium]
MSIKIKDLTVTFKNNVTAVDHANLEIPGGIYGLLGENGAGKTTLMRVLTTVLKPSSGMAFLDGISYEERNYEKIQQKIGYLPQEIDLYPNLTVRECLEYMGDLSGIKKEVYKKRIDEYLEKTSLTEHQKKKMRQLSGGMKRRVGLIQALLNDPKFLIVDEPTTGLDPEERIRIRNLLVDFSENRTVLFSTHVVEDLAATCTRLSIMKKGKFLYTGSVKDLMAKAAGRIWVITLKDETQAKNLESHYTISSKQYTEEGIKIKFISETTPPLNARQPEITLEDAYLYLTNQEP